MINKINTEIKNAMLTKDASKRDVLRAVKSAANLIAKEKHVDVCDEHIITAVQREIKTLNGTIMSMKDNASATEAVNDAKYRIIILEEYLPSMMSPEFVEAEVNRILSGMESLNMGLAMKAVMAELKGKADGKVISAAVAKHLKK